MGTAPAGMPVVSMHALLALVVLLRGHSGYGALWFYSD
jgi:hypothetical protein